MASHVETTPMKKAADDTFEFPVDLSTYRKVEINPFTDTELSAQQLEDLTFNINLCRDAIVFSRRAAPARGKLNSRLEKVVCGKVWTPVDTTGARWERAPLDLEGSGGRSRSGRGQRTQTASATVRVGSVHKQTISSQSCRCWLAEESSDCERSPRRPWVAWPTRRRWVSPMRYGN